MYITVWQDCLRGKSNELFAQAWAIRTKAGAKPCCALQAAHNAGMPWRLSEQHQDRFLSILQSHWAYLRRYQLPPSGQSQRQLYLEDVLVHQIMNLIVECRTEVLARNGKRSKKLLDQIRNAVWQLTEVRVGRRLPS